MEANLKILALELDDLFPDEEVAAFAMGLSQDATMLRQTMRVGLGMRGSSATSRRKTQTPRSRKKRKASAWNTFVKTEMPKVLKAHPRFTPQRAMKEVSKRWRSSPKNPNRGRRKR